VDWDERYERAAERYRGGKGRGLDQRQLTQLANAAWAAGLCLLMAGRRDDAAEWLRRAAVHYRESWDAGAPHDSWGRPIAAMKALLLAEDDATGAARWALDAGAAAAESPIGRYAAVLALLVLGRDDEALALAETLLGRDDFPGDVATAVEALAVHDGVGYAAAVGDVLRSFEARDEFLEDIPVADTVLVLERLADERGIGLGLGFSERLPSRPVS
jgi:tetratricopeptide (TPR) repeat protein